MKIIKMVKKVDFNERPLRSAIAQIYNLKAYMIETQSSITNVNPEEKKKAIELVNSVMKAIEELKKETTILKKQIG